MQVEARRVNVLAPVGKAHGDVRLVGTLIRGKSRVAVDAEHRAARWTRIGDEMRRDFI